MLRLAIVGGNWNNTLLDGPFTSNLNNTASNANTNNGAAQSYLSFDDSHTKCSVYRCLKSNRRLNCLFLTAW